MAEQTLSNPALAATGAGVPSTLDAHGFDPGAFEWRPVPRRPRADGWSPEVQQRFIGALAVHGTVAAAAREVNMSVASAYRLRDAPGAEGFARAWDDVLASAARRLLDLCFERAIDGVEEPVFDRDGVRIGARRRFDHRLAALLLRAYMPERFRHAHRDTRTPDEAPPPAARPAAEAIAALAPVTPAAPQLSASPERMATLIDGARGRAEVEALYPRDEREPYREPPRAPDHPQALARRHVRQERVAARDDRSGVTDWAARFAGPDAAAAAEAEGGEASPSPHLPPAGSGNRRQRRAVRAKAR